MKKKVLILLVMSMLFSFFGGCTKTVEIGDVVYLSFSYSTGYSMNSRTLYKFDSREGSPVVTIKPFGKADEMAQEYIVDEEFVNRLTTILKENSVGKWNGFKKNDKHVLDGDDFDMYIVFSDESSIEASGYEKYPAGYSEVKDALDELFGGLWQEIDNIEE